MGITGKMMSLAVGAVMLIGVSAVQHSTE